MNSNLSPLNSGPSSLNSSPSTLVSPPSTLNSPETLVQVQNVSKKFCRTLKGAMWYGIKDIGSELFGRRSGGGRGPDQPELRPDEFWALQNVNFELKRGECLGLIGRNGAGKSTLLKMLNGLIKPDTGRIEMHGRIGALIELGTGFNPILTGRENIYINGSLLGFSKAEIDRKYDAIVDFSEIGEFIDMPVQNYSSGMKVRLGFSVAAQMEPDVLLIDEVLAVGDMGFILKSMNRMDKLLTNTCIIFVSHNIPQVARMCTDLILMDHGKVVFNGSDVAEGINQYYSSQDQQIGCFFGSGRAMLRQIFIESNSRRSSEKETLIVHYGDMLKVYLQIELNQNIREPVIYLAFYNKEQRGFAELFSRYSGTKFENRSGILAVEITIPSINFAQGFYSITIAVSELRGQRQEVLFRHQSAIFFQVDGIQHGWAPIQLQGEWRQLEHLDDKHCGINAKGPSSCHV